MTITIGIIKTWQFWLARFIIVYALHAFFGLTFRYINIVLGVLLLLVGILLLVGG